jgi:hypothetical protein
MDDAHSMRAVKGNRATPVKCEQRESAGPRVTAAVETSSAPCWWVMNWEKIRTCALGDKMRGKAVTVFRFPREMSLRES